MSQTPASIQKVKAAVASCFDSALQMHRAGEDVFKVVGSHAVGMDAILSDLFLQEFPGEQQVALLSLIHI